MHAALPLPRLRVLALCVLLASLGGCTREIHVTVVESHDLRPRFVLGHSAEGIPEAIPVNEIRVVPEDDGRWDYGHPTWCASLDPGTFEPVTDVRYGETPSGFGRCAATRPLQFGHRYLVSVSGAGVVAKTEFQAGR